MNIISWLTSMLVIMYIIRLLKLMLASSGKEEKLGGNSVSLGNDEERSTNLSRDNQGKNLSKGSQGKCYNIKTINMFSKSDYAYYNGKYLPVRNLDGKNEYMVSDDDELGWKWCYFIVDEELGKSLGFKEGVYKKGTKWEYHFFYLPIKDEKTVSAFTVNTRCTIEGYDCYFYWCDGDSDHISILVVSSEALTHFGFDAYAVKRLGVGFERMDNIHLSELEEIHYERRPLCDFIFDVEPNEYIWKDGKWLIEPVDGVYFINTY